MSIPCPDLFENDGAKLLAKIDSFKNYRDFENYYRTFFKSEPLHHAIRCKNANIAKTLILKGANVHNPDICSFTPLYYALKTDDEKLVKILLENGVSARGTFIDNKVRTFYFQHVCQYSNHKIVKLFLNHGCTVNESFTLTEWNCLRTTRPLHAAAMNNRFETVKLLIDLNANVNEKNELDETPLFVACMEGHKDIVELLLKNNALVNICTKTNDTPLYHGIRSHNPDIVKFLLEYGAIIGSEELDIIYNVCIPLNGVIQMGNLQILEYLLEAGLDSNINIDLYHKYCYSGEPTFLHTAVKSNKPEIVKLLLKYNASINIKNNKGRIPLHIAAEVSHQEMVQILLEHDPNLQVSVEKSTINALDNCGQTPLHIACRAKNIECIQYLINCGADITAETNKGDTILHIATSAGIFNVVKFLVKSNVPINVYNDDGESPLHIAVAKKYKPIIELFLKNNAITTCQNKDGCIPLELNISDMKFTDVDIVEMLLIFAPDINDVHHRRAFRTVLNTYLMREHADVHTYWRNRKGSNGLVEIFFKHGLTLSKEDEDIDLMLFSAVSGGNIRITDILLKLGANPNTEKNDESILHIATMKKSSDIIDLLLKHGAKVKVYNRFRELPLHYAIKNNDLKTFEIFFRNKVSAKEFPGLLHDVVKHNPSGCYEFIKILVMHDADVNYFCDGFHIVHSLLKSIEDNQYKCNPQCMSLTYLFRNGADVNARTKDSASATPLHMVSNIAIEVINTLLDFRAEVNARDGDGNTPLHTHIMNKNFYNIENLLRHGADINAKNSAGLMAADMILQLLPDPKSRVAVDICTKHAIKLLTANMFLHPKILEPIFHIRPNFVWHMEPVVNNDFLPELEGIKKFKVYAKITAYDVLVRSITSVARFSKAVNIKSIEEKIKQYRYYQYGNMVVERLVRSRKYEPYLLKTKKVLNSMRENGLPDACSERIMGYLDLEDLINLTNVLSLP